MTKDIPVGNRIMDRAYLRDGDTIHTGEALLIALLLHAKGKTNRGRQELEEISRIMLDPNLTKPKKGNKRG